MDRSCSAEVVIQLVNSKCPPYLSYMSVDHGEGTGGTNPPPPEFGAGDANTNCPRPRFCHIGTKISVLWPSKYGKIRFRPGRTPLEELHDAPPYPLVSWRGDIPPHIPPHSARTHLRRSPCVPPEVQSDLRLCYRMT